jgi:hypothetical protein
MRKAGSTKSPTAQEREVKSDFMLDESFVKIEENKIDIKPIVVQKKKIMVQSPKVISKMGIIPAAMRKTGGRTGV